jgi:FkbM family methyltransferase
MIFRLIKLPVMALLAYFEVRKSPIPSNYYTWKDLFGFKLRLYWKSMFSDKSKELTMDFKGKKLFAPNLGTMEYLFDEIFVHGEYYQPQIKGEIKTIYDCGANIGFATIFFKILFPEARILCFEPNPKTFQSLERNIEINHFSNVHLNQIALSKEEGMLDLYFTEDVSVTASIDSGRSDFDQMVSVPTKKLSDFMLNAKPDLVKMDVEGAEHFIIEDLIGSTILGSPSYYLLEYHNHGNIFLFASFIEKFAKLGFNYQLQAKINRKKVFQDHLLLLWK